MKSQSVAIVGASGFVGGHLLRVLRARGHEVRAAVRNPDAMPGDPDVRVADACDVYALREALEGCEYVVHSVVGPPEVIVGSVAPVYAAAQAVGARRLLYISTGSVHGQSPGPGADETARLTVQQPFAYNTAKVRAERKLRRLRTRGTVELVMLRPTIVWGPGSRWVYDFAAALRNQSAYVVDGAKGVCNSIYVDNLAHAVALALTAPGIDGEVFLVGDDEPIAWSDFYRPIAAAMGFPFDDVPSLPPPDLTLGARQKYVEPFRSSEIGQALCARIPTPLKSAVRGGLRAARALAGGRQSAPAAPSMPPNESPRLQEVSLETALLHTCRWRLPDAKARQMLGYAAVVSFPEGIRRSIEWLRCCRFADRDRELRNGSRVAAA